MSAVRLPIGRRGRRFTLEVQVEAPDGFGGVVRTFQPGPQLWGAMEPVSAGERIRQGRTEDRISHRVKLDWRAGVSGGMRLSLGPRRFRIVAASDPDGRRQILICLVEEFTA